MSESSFLPYARQSINDDDIQRVSSALKGDLITRGSLVTEFETKIAEYCGAKYGVAFNSATSALMATYFAAKVGANDRVVTTPNSFVATVGPASFSNATPVFVDIDRSTGNLDLKQVEYNLNVSSTRGKVIVVPVHFSGIPVDMEMMDRLNRNPNAIVIEDAAHAIGSCYKDGQRVGSCTWSDMTVFSFHPAKTMTMGEGGMVTTNQEELYHLLQVYRNNGIEKEQKYLQEEEAPGYYEVQSISGNFNVTEMQAALGLSQFSRLDRFVEKRRRLMGVYRKLLKDVPEVQMFTDEFDSHTAFHLCVVQINFEHYRTNRVTVMTKLKEKGIGSQVHYIPIYRHPYFKNKNGDISEYFPQTEAYYSQALSLPLYYDLEEKDVERVVKTLKDALKRNKRV